MIRGSRLGQRFLAQRGFHSSSYKWQDNKLRILFCGSSDFSVTHLKALYEYQQSAEGNIASIDVVTKTDKRTGRGLKLIKPPPIKNAALALGLPLHQIDTFTGWTPPGVDLIIAVSFGLLVPPRVIRGSRYGGLNVHPSLLPDLRGAAPIDWAIAYGRKHTGVSIQTLHETKFDHGIILDQSDKIEVPPRSTWTQIVSLLEPISTKMLVDALKHHLYLPPYKPVVVNTDTSISAPKIRDEHKLIDFQTMTSEDIDRRGRAFGFLHGFVDVDGQKRRVKMKICSEIQQSDKPSARIDQDIPAGVPYTQAFAGEDLLNSKHRELRVKTIDGRHVVIQELTIEGRRRGPAAQEAARAHLFLEPKVMADGALHIFKQPLTTT